MKSIAIVINRHKQLHMKNNIIATLFACFLFTISCKQNIESNPSAYLNPEQIDYLKENTSRYYAGLSKKSTHKDKFDSKYDSYYKDQAQKHDLLYYYKDPDTNYEYFALTRIAPSVTLKKVAIVGRLLRKNNKIIDYEEKFRTWKMPEPELKEKTKKLFDLYILDKDLSEYETANSNPEFYIEFPDNNTYYDKNERVWITK